MQEGFAYLAVVIDLFSRRVVGWSPLGRLLRNRLPGSEYKAARRPKSCCRLCTWLSGGTR
jgi:transposase InsO family protein